MSREIKFRAFNPMGKEMIYPSREGHGKMTSGWILNNYSELMQFTGLLDRNGKEIYEGDIVKCNWLAELGITELDCEAIGTVQWDKDNPCFYIQLNKEYKRTVAEEMVYEETALALAPTSDEGISIEIIGNIYEQDGSGQK